MVDPSTMIAGEVVVSLAGDLVKAIAKKVTRFAVGTEQENTLRKVLIRAIEQTVADSHQGSSDSDRGLIYDILRDSTAHPNVAEVIVDTALKNSTAEHALVRLSEEFTRCGFEPSTIEFHRVFTPLIAEVRNYLLSEAGTQSSPIQGQVLVEVVADIQDTVHRIETSSISSSGISADAVLDAMRRTISVFDQIRSKIWNTDIELRRSLVDALISWLDEPSMSEGNKRNNFAVVLAGAGQGKSVVIKQLAAALVERRVPVIGIKADTLAGTGQSVSLPNDLAAALQLPASIDVCAWIVARQQQCVVLVDGLDALALAQSVLSPALRVVFTQIARLRSIPNVKIIASCRDSEWRIDPNLQGTAVDRQFILGPLSDDEANSILRAVAGLSLKDLPQPLAMFAKTPLYLDILAQIVAAGAEATEIHASTLTELYDALWNTRVVADVQGAPPSNDRVRAIYALVEAMTRNTSLHVATSVLDLHSPARQFLLSIGFIQSNQDSLSFLHQTLFSYCFARKFIGEERSLSKEVIDGPQSFFERQLTKEVLQHLRDMHSPLYLTELRALLFPECGRKLRYHLRQLLLKWIAEQTEPSEREFSLMLEVLEADPADFIRWLYAVTDKSGWYNHILREVPVWFASDEEVLLTASFGFLSRAREISLRQIIPLIAPYLNQSSAWNRRIGSLLMFHSNWTGGERGTTILVELTRRSEITPKNAVYALVGMASSDPAVGIPLLELFCNVAEEHVAHTSEQNVTSAAVVSAASEALDLLDTWEVHQFLAACEQLPAQVMQHIFPWFIRVAPLLEEQFPVKAIKLFDLDSAYVPNRDRDVTLGQVLVTALACQARDDPGAFRSSFAVAAISSARVVHRVLMRAIAAEPRRYAKEIIEYLQQGKDRVYLLPELGRLVAATHKHNNDEVRKQLENFILSLGQERIENRPRSLGEWRDRFRTAQFRELILLDWIDSNDLSDRSLRRKQELLRIRDFEGYRHSASSVFLGPGIVEAPIGRPAQSNLSDNDWLRIMRRYGDTTSWHSPMSQRDFFLGGVIEMSRDFTTQVTAAPSRFLRLSTQFDHSIASAYVAALFVGLCHKDAAVEPSEVFHAFERLNAHIEGEYRTQVARALSERFLGDIPQDVIDVFVTWASEDEDPDCSADREQLAYLFEHTETFHDEFLGRGLNNVRGGTLHAACVAMGEKKIVPVGQLLIAIRNGAEDRCPSVNAIALEHLIQWVALGQDKDTANAIFVETVMRQPSLLACNPAKRYLNWLCFHYPALSAPFVNAMLRLPHEPTRRFGAELACLAHIHGNPEFGDEFASMHLDNDVVLRQAAAAIYSREIADPSLEELCCERLLILVNDPDDTVRAEVAHSPRYIVDASSSHIREYLSAFIDSPTFRTNGDELADLLSRLPTNTTIEQQYVIDLAAHILEHLGSEAGGLSHGYWSVQRELALLLRSMCDRDRSTVIQVRAMDLFDLLVQHGSHEAVKIVDSEDAEWLGQSQTGEPEGK